MAIYVVILPAATPPYHRDPQAQPEFEPYRNPFRHRQTRSPRLILVTPGP